MVRNSAQTPACVIPIAGGSPIESLPAEILEIIFHPSNFPISNNPKESYLATTPSKLLYPHLVKVLYYSVRLSSIEEIELLAEACLNPLLGPLIRHLTMPTSKISRAFYRGRLVEIIFKSAINLKSSEGPAALHKTLFTESYCRDHGKKLELVVLQDEDCGGMVDWSHLGYLPVLKKLEMDILTTEVYSCDRGPPLLALEELIIRFYEFDGDSEDDSFFTIFPTLLPNLTSLSLECGHYGVYCNFLPILESFDSSIHSLKKLELRSLFGSPQPLEPLGQLIATLTSLESLEIQFPITKDFINSIAELENLHHFTNYSAMDYDDSILLLSNLRLKVLGINFSVQSGSISTSYEEGAELVLDERKCIVPGKGWRRPIWRGMTRAEAMDLIRRAEEKGVVLLEPEHRSTVADAIANDLAYEKELEWCEKVMNFLRIGEEGFEKELGLI